MIIVLIVSLFFAINELIYLYIRNLRMTNLSKNEEFVTMEDLKEKFLILQYKLIKMEEDIKDFVNRLHDTPNW